MDFPPFEKGESGRAIARPKRAYWPGAACTEGSHGPKTGPPEYPNPLMVWALGVSFFAFLKSALIRGNSRTTAPTTTRARPAKNDEPKLDIPTRTKIKPAITRSIFTISTPFRAAYYHDFQTITTTRITIPVIPGRAFLIIFNTGTPNPTANIHTSTVFQEIWLLCFALSSLTFFLS